MKQSLAFSLVAMSVFGCGSEGTAVDKREVGVATQALITHPGQLGPLAAWLYGNAGVTTNASGQVTAWADQTGNGKVLGRGDLPLVSAITRDFVPGSTRKGILFADPNGAHGYLVNASYKVKPPLTIGMVVHTLPRKAPLASHVLTGATAPTIAVGQECAYTLVGSLPASPATVCPVPGFPTMCYSTQPTITCPQGLSICPSPSQLPPTVTYDCKFGAVAGGPTTIVRDTLWADGTHHIIATFNGSGSTLRVDGSPGTAGTLTPSALDGMVLSAGGGKDFRGYIGEIVVYNGVLSDADQFELFAYFQSRYPR